MRRPALPEPTHTPPPQPQRTRRQATKGTDTVSIEPTSAAFQPAKRQRRAPAKTADSPHDSEYDAVQPSHRIALDIQRESASEGEVAGEALGNAAMQRAAVAVAEAAAAGDAETFATASEAATADAGFVTVVAESAATAEEAAAASAADPHFSGAAEFSDDDGRDQQGGGDEAAAAGHVTEEHVADRAGAAGKAKGRLSADRLQRMKASYAKRGVVYISRIPPHMKPLKMRHMLSAYGELGRLYLAPEDSAARKKRKKAGGNTGKNFTEGWVEFEDKGVAKHVAAMLNGQQMGGKRRSAYHYDLWSMKYLPKFKWDHLTEEVAYQNAVREQKLAAEISAATRERDFYLSRVDRAKGIAAIKARKEKLTTEGGGGAAGAEPGAELRTKPGSGYKGGAVAAAAGVRAPLRMYGQRKAKADPVADAHAPALSADVLSMIAGRK